MANVPTGELQKNYPAGNLGEDSGWPGQCLMRYIKLNMIMHFDRGVWSCDGIPFYNNDIDIGRWRNEEYVMKIGLSIYVSVTKATVRGKRGQG